MPSGKSSSLRRVDEEKAVKVLRAIFSIIERMNIIDLR